MSHIESKLFKPLTREEIDAIVKDYWGPLPSPMGCTLLKGGLFNTTYLLEGELPEHKWILRVAPEQLEHLFSFEKKMMASEGTIYRLMNVHGIPAPHVLHYNDSHTHVNRNYMIMEYIDSIPMNDPSITPEEHAMLEEELGRCLKKMHDITADRFGWPQPDGSVLGHDKWSAALTDFAQEVYDRCQTGELVESSLLEEFLACYTEQAPLYDEIKIPALVHNDIWDPNVLVTRNEDGVPQIAAIIDADRAMYSDREFELLLGSDAPAFMKGYQAELNTSPQAAARRTAYQMLWKFASIYIFDQQIGDLEAASKYRLEAEQLLRRFQQQIQA